MTISDLDVNILTVFTLNVAIFIGSVIVFFGYLLRRDQAKRLNYARLIAEEGEAVQPSDSIAQSDASSSESLLKKLLPFWDKQSRNELFSFFKISRPAHVLKNCGRDAAVYLIFQQFLCVALFVLGFLGLSVLVPINATTNSPPEKDEDKSSIYTHTTVENALMDHSVLWVHAIFCPLFVVIVSIVLILFQRSKTVSHRGDGSAQPSSSVANYPISSKSLMLNSVPQTIKTDAELLTFVKEEMHVETAISSQLTWDVSAYVSWKRKREQAEDDISHYEAFLEQKRKRARKVSFSGSWPFIRRCDALEEAQHAFEQAKREEAVEKEKLKSHPVSTGHGFLMFGTFDDAQNALHNHSIQPLSPTLAPEPLDIIWENLTPERNKRRIRVFGVHMSLIAIAVFLSTPLAIVGAIMSVFAGSSDSMPQLVSSFLLAYLPTLLLYIVSLYIPDVIQALTELELHATKSKIQRIVMVRNFVYLVLSTLILPTISLTLIDAIHEYQKTNDVGKTMQQAFLPESGIFFVLYVIQAAFLGSSIEMLRIRERLLRWWAMRSAVRPCERRKALEPPPFNALRQTSVFVCILAITLTYSIFTPTILLFGVFYLSVKHLVDHYNIRTLYARGESEMSSLSSDAYRRRMKSMVLLVVAFLIIFELYVFYFFSIKLIYAQASFLLVVVIGSGAFFTAWASGILKHTPLRFMESTPLMDSEQAQALPTEPTPPRPQLFPYACPWIE